MPNPWLTIPLADYEAHMALAEVAQAQFLARTLGALIDARPQARSVAVLGCAGASRGGCRGSSSSWAICSTRRSTSRRWSSCMQGSCSSTSTR